MAGEKIDIIEKCIKPIKQEKYYKREAVRLTVSNIILRNQNDELIAENRLLQKQITELQLERVE